MAPKKPLSSSSVLLRRRASCSSIRPAERSASIAICLPGMASRWKRAATSAMRPEPLVMTTKFTITRIVNTMMPITKLPLITKLPNASITWPAAAVPSWPCERMRRVEARLSASRSMVAISSTVGKEENSSGVWMNKAVIMISTEMMIEMARNRSRTTGGSGRMRTTRIVITPMASARSPRRNRIPTSPSVGNLKALAVAGAAAVVSVISSNAAVPGLGTLKNKLKIDTGNDARRMRPTRYGSAERGG